MSMTIQPLRGHRYTVLQAGRDGYFLLNHIPLGLSWQEKNRTLAFGETLIFLKSLASSDPNESLKLVFQAESDGYIGVLYPSTFSGLAYEWVIREITDPIPRERIT